MSERENKDLLARYFSEVWGEANVSALSDFLSPSYKRHVSAIHPPIDLAGQIERLEAFRAAFPDIALSVEDVIAEGDQVAFRSTMRGTHLGEFAGIAPTGRRVTVQLVDVIRIEDGAIVEQWGGPDLFDLLQQLRAIVR